MRVTTANAKEVLEKLDAEDRARSAAAANGQPGEVPPASDHVESPDDPDGQAGGTGDEGTDGQGSASTDGNPEDEAPETPEDEGTWKAKYEALQREHTILDRNFRNIQRQITPTQQKNAELTRRVAELEEKFGLKPEQIEEARRKKLDAVRESFPEVAEALEELDQSVNSLKGKEAADPTPAANHPDALTRIFEHHSDLTPDELARDSAFWAYIDSLPVEMEARALLSRPDQHFEGAERVIDLIQNYKDLKGTARKPKASDTPRPTVVQPSTAKQSVRPTPGTKPQGMTREQIEQRSLELRRQLRGADAKKSAEILKELQGLDTRIAELAGA